MNSRIHELLHRNLQEVFGEADAARRRAAIDELYTEDCVLYVPPGRSSGVRPSTNLPAISARLTRTSLTTRTGNLRPSTMPVVWLGVPARVARRPTIRAWTSSSFAMGRSRRSTCSSIPCLHSCHGAPVGRRRLMVGVRVTVFFGR